MTTTNNLIGYDPLAWMDGADIEEETPPVEVAKKATKSRAKAKAVAVEEPVVVEEVAEEMVENEIVAEVSAPVVIEEEITEEIVDNEDIVEESDDVEIDVSIDADGEIEITVEADKNTEVNVQVSIEKIDTPIEEHVIESVAEQVTDEVEVVENVIEEIPVEKEEVVMSEEAHVEEAPIAAPAEPHIDLPAESTIKTVATLYDTVKHALEAHDAIEINASDVTAIDTATLQLLVSLKKDAPNLGKTVDIIYPSDRFVESAKLLGLLDVLEVSAH